MTPKGSSRAWKKPQGAPNVRAYRCPYCGRVFYGTSPLRAHWRECGMGKKAS